LVVVVPAQLAMDLPDNQGQILFLHQDNHLH
jgi:hypothetical protein